MGGLQLCQMLSPCTLLKEQWHNRTSFCRNHTFYQNFQIVVKGLNYTPQTYVHFYRLQSFTESPDGWRHETKHLRHDVIEIGERHQIIVRQVSLALLRDFRDCRLQFVHNVGVFVETQYGCAARAGNGLQGPEQQLNHQVGHLGG